MGDDKLTPDYVRERLGRVKYPGFPRDIVSLGMVAAIALDAGRARIELRLPGGATEVPTALGEAIAAELKPLGLIAEARVAGAGGGRGAAGAPLAGAAAEPEVLPGVRSVLAVASAKGGVGKSTVASNLACAFAVAGLRTGLLDADVYGPSLPLMMGTDERPKAAGAGRFRPVERHGVRCLSMGFFLDESSPVIWRGPLVAGLIRQFVNDCVWGDLDVLVIDLPPGTGDAQLTLVQLVRVTGALIVTTPQEIALRDVLRGVSMFRQVQVPILGVVENMSAFVCPECGARDEVFGSGGGAAVAAVTGRPVLAQIPIDPGIRECGDRGLPVVLGQPQSPAAEAYVALAAALATALGVARSDAVLRVGP